MKLQEFKYAYKHKPTQKWVNLVSVLSCPQVELYGYSTEIKLVDTLEWASTHTDINVLKEDLLVARFNGSEYYGKENFLEFEIIKIE